MLPRFRIIIYALRFNRFLKIDGTNKPVVSMDYLKTLRVQMYNKIFEFPKISKERLLQSG